MTKYLFVLVAVSLTFFSCKEEIRLIKNSQGETRTAQQIDAFFDSLIDTLEIPGMSVAIINDAKIVYSKSFGVKQKGTRDSVTHATIFEAASLSKPLFAYFVMKQVEKGLLDLDKPLYNYLPYPDIEYDERYKSITARMILSHASGFPNWRQDSLKIYFTPGTNYMYSGEGYKYLAHVMAAVNQVEFTQLDSIFQSEIPGRIHAERLYYKWNDDIAANKASGHINGEPTGNKRDHKDNDFGAAGGLHTEATSYSQFLISIFEHKILSQELTHEMFQEQIELPEDDINKLLIGATGWSLGFGMIPTQNEDICYWHAGNNDDFQSWMHFYPSQKYGIVLFANADKVQHPDFFNLFFDFMDDGINFDLSRLQ